MDRFAAMQSFRRVVERGGFAAGAKALGLSKATVSKQVSALESHLGAMLLQRTTRRLSLTEAGQAFYADTVRILDDIAGAETQVAEGQADPRGLLRTNAPLSFGVSRLMPVVSGFMTACPKVRIDLAPDDRTVDPVGQAFDVTLRIRTALEDSELTARRIGGIAHTVCAAPDYFTSPPTRPEDLLNHRMLVYGTDGAGARSMTMKRGRSMCRPAHTCRPIPGDGATTGRAGPITTASADCKASSLRSRPLITGWFAPGCSDHSMMTDRPSPIR